MYKLLHFMVVLLVSFGLVTIGYIIFELLPNYQYPFAIVWGGLSILLEMKLSQKLNS